MFCTNCGHKIPNDANFCGYCGQRVNHFINTQPTEASIDLISDKAEDIVIQDNIFPSYTNVTNDNIVPKASFREGINDSKSPYEPIYTQQTNPTQHNKIQNDNRITTLHKGKIMILSKDRTTDKVFFYNYFSQKVSSYYNNANPSDELGRARVEIAGKWGVIDSEFNIIIPALYDYIWPFLNNLAVVSLYGKYGIINLKGEEVFPTIYDEIRLQTNNLIAINLNHEFGYKDIKGKDIIPLGKYYDNQWIAHDGFSKISYHNKYEKKKKNGTIIAPIYDDATSFENGFAEVLYNNQWFCIDKYGVLHDTNSIESHRFSEHNMPYDCIAPFSNGLAAVCQNKQWGYINKNGEIVIKLQYDACENFSEGLAIVCKNNKYGCIDKDGNVIINFIYQNLIGPYCGGISAYKSNLMTVQKGFLNYQGDWIVKWTSPNILPIMWLGKGGIVSNKTVNQFGLIDPQGKLILPILYDDIHCLEYDNNILIIQQNNKYGIINIFGEVISSIVYESIKEIGNSKLSIETQSGKFIADLHGKQLSQLYEDIQFFQEGLCAIRLNGKWGFIDNKLHLVIPCVYDAIDSINYHFVYEYAEVISHGRSIFINKNGDEFEDIEKPDIINH